MALKEACANFYDRMHDDSNNVDSDMDVESDTYGDRTGKDGGLNLDGSDGSEDGGVETLDDRVWREVVAEVGVEMLDFEGGADSQHSNVSRATPPPFVEEKSHGAGATYGRGLNIFEKAETSHAFAEERKKPGQENYPFLSEDEWEVGSWLASAGLSMAKQDEFLKLSWVSISHRPAPQRLIYLYHAR